ncbi:hypothetical protein ACFXTH_006234 [Malus domestica]
MAGEVMGDVVHTIMAPIERAKFLLQTQKSNLAIFGSGRTTRGWSIASPRRSGKKASCLFGEEMAAASFATTLPSLSIFPSSHEEKQARRDLRLGQLPNAFVQGTRFLPNQTREHEQRPSFRMQDV